MQIFLMRHGEPDINKHLWLNAREFGVWVRQYDEAGIAPHSRPSQATIELAKQCKFVVCSSLTRSLESAHLLGMGQIDRCEAQFRELELPSTKGTWLKLPVKVWTVLFRVADALGYSSQTEPFKLARQRARECAAQLMQLANEHESVLFVGHGSLNWLIARTLKQKGWQASAKSPRRYWETTVYTKAKV